MKKNIMPCWALWFLIAATLLHARTEETFSQAVDARPGASVVIEKFSGDISIQGTDENELSVTVDLEVKNGSQKLADEFIANSSLTITQTGDGYRVKFDTPMLSDESTVPEALLRNFKTLLRGGAWQISSAQKMEVRLPKKQNLSLQNSYGDVSVVNVFGELSLHNSSGEILVRDSGGRLNAENSYATAEVFSFDGPVRIKSSSGEVKLNDISGDVDVANSYKPVASSNPRAPRLTARM